MGVFADLTVRENLLLAARSGPPDAARLDWIFGFFPALKRFWTHPAGVLSGGQKQMLSIARAIVEPRRLILIDEPTKGLAPAIIDNMIRAFRELKRDDDDHPAGRAELPLRRRRWATAVVMDDGRIVHRDSMAALAARHGDADAPARPVAGGAWVSFSHVHVRDGQRRCASATAAWAEAWPNVDDGTRPRRSPFRWCAPTTCRCCWCRRWRSRRCR